ncbi:extracellular solute-binding protein [bacterium]|nr:extracellular solute-binding protein [bacterium]
MLTRLLGLGTLISVLALSGCTKNKDGGASGDLKKGMVPDLNSKMPSEKELLGTFKLPAGLKWETNDSDPTYASSDAVKGGSYTASISSYPLTFRYVGPDSNGSFRGNINENRLGLTGTHPNTRNPVPELATHWATGKDNKTVYYKLDPKARWSDGKPVTADDFVFMLKFMRSKHIVAPWYNHHYTNEIEAITKHSPWVLSVKTAKPHPKKLLLDNANQTPVPAHFHKLDKDWIKNYNWKTEPNTGPYMITDFKKGKNVVFTRKKNWWASERKYYKNRFNVDRVFFKVVRDLNAQWEYFKKGELETMGLTLPQYWHDKAKGEIWDKGYVNKLWFYTDSPQPIYGMWLNTADSMWKEDKNLRYAFAHAMNVDKVLKQVLRGDYERLNTTFHGYGDYSNYDIKAREFNLGKVDELMKLSGWARGKDGIWKKGPKRFSVTVTYGAAHHQDRLVVIQEEAKKAGIEVNLHLLDSSASFKTMLEKKHQVAWTGWGAGMIPAYRQFYHSENANKPQNNNFSNTSDPEIDKAIEKYRNTFDEKEKAKVSRKIQALVHEEGSTITTFLVPYFRIGYWRYWRLPETPGTKLSGSSFDLFSTSTGGLFWLDQGMKEETLKAKKVGKGFGKSTVVNKGYKI